MRVYVKKSIPLCSSNIFYHSLCACVRMFKKKYTCGISNNFYLSLYVCICAPVYVKKLYTCGNSNDFHRSLSLCVCICTRVYIKKILVIFLSLNYLIFLISLYICAPCTLVIFLMVFISLSLCRNSSRTCQGTSPSVCILRIDIVIQ